MTETAVLKPLDSLGTRNRRVVSALFAAGAALVFLFAAFPSRYTISSVSWGAQPTGTDLVVTMILLALCAGVMAYAICSAMRAENLVVIAIALIAVCAGMFLRFIALDHVTTDYSNFLAQWTNTFRRNGWKAITMAFADYNMPYLYIVAIIAKIPLQDMFMFKTVSIIFDCALALAALRLGKTLGMKGFRLAVLVSAVWMAPTVWLNSAFWAQCDSIYVFFVVMALTTALEDKPARSMIFAAIAFSFKLQTIFFLPVYIVFWMAKKMKFWHFAVFPLAYLATVLPAWISGKPLREILLVYLNQTGTYADRLNLNSPSMYALLWTTDDSHDFFFMAGLIMAVVFVCVVFGWMFLKRDRLNRKTLALCALLLAAGIPWLLPSMHERYFYIADVLCIVMAVLIPKRWFLAPFCVFASYAGYHAYLFLVYLPYIGLALPSFILMTAIGAVAYELWTETSRPPAGKYVPPLLAAVEPSGEPRLSEE